VERYIIAQTQLPEDTIQKLKEKTGESTIKDALAKAIEHYLMCVYVEPPKKEKYKKRRSGRLPIYLTELVEQYKEMISGEMIND
jgi:hypothetical protein